MQCNVQKTSCIHSVASLSGTPVSQRSLFSCVVVLEAVVCDAVELNCIIMRGVSNI